MGSSLTNEAGLRDADITIDDTSVTLPLSIEFHNTNDSYDFALSWELSDKTTAEKNALQLLAGLRASAVQNVYQTLAGRYVATAPYRGTGLPDVGSVHTFAFWKALRFKYSGIAGQSVFYLPTPDAFSKAYAGKTDQSRYGAIVTVAGSQISLANTLYKPSVVSADVVTAGQVWISNTAVAHPDSGINVALFKLGTALATAGTVIVDYIPLFNVLVTAAPLKPFEKPAREDQQLFLLQTI